MRQLLFILLNLLIYNTGSSQSIKIPYGKSAVMIDGKFNPAEWDDAIKVKLSDSLMLHFKQDHHYIYWCLQGMFQKPALRGVDFYITNNSTMINLHTSAQLGERTFTNMSYGGWIWWNNDSWVATVSRPVTASSFLADEAKEFQLHKSRFSNRSIRLMLSIAAPDILPAYPSDATTTSSLKWLLLDL